MYSIKLHLYRIFILLIMLRGLNVGQSTRWTYSKLTHWTSGVYEESLAFVGTILSEMLTFII